MSTNVRNANGILPVKMVTQPIIPLVYSDALSYLEIVSKLTQKVNEVIDNVNNIQTDILTDANAYTDNSVREALGSVSKAVQEIKNLKSELQTQYGEFVRLTNSQIVVFDRHLSNLNKRIDDTIIGINKRTDLAIQQNNEYIINNLGSYLSQIRVVNFFTGEKVSIQNMFDYMGMLHVDKAMTYEYLVDKRMTYNTLASINMTYTQMVLYGKDLVG